ncbi:MAG: cupin domain-containing protein [Candidatus Izemoplasmatales bacterium]
MKHFNLYDLPQIANKYNVKARTLFDEKSSTIKNLFLDKGEEIPKHQFPLDVTFFILEGKGKIQIEDEVFIVKPFDTVICPPNHNMSVKADEDSVLSFLNIKSPGLKSL